MAHRLARRPQKAPLFQLAVCAISIAGSASQWTQVRSARQQSSAAHFAAAIGVPARTAGSSRRSTESIEAYCAAFQLVRVLQITEPSQSLCPLRFALTYR